MNYYNEWDPKTAAWLRELIKAGLIPQGEVDERSITDVRPGDLAGFKQCHFFAGIGGWPYALKLAGWPEDREVWTGSCPCQPFSRVGDVWKVDRGLGSDRDLWPPFFQLIKKRRPPTLFGEQVADAITNSWLDRTFDEMERIDYACGAAALPALSVGTPQERMRLWFVCDTRQKRRKGLGLIRQEYGTSQPITAWGETARAGSAYRGKEWLTKPGICLLADGLPGSVDWRCGAFGNAIVPELAAEFVRSYLESKWT